MDTPFLKELITTHLRPFKDAEEKELGWLLEAIDEEAEKLADTIEDMPDLPEIAVLAQGWRESLDEIRAAVNGWAERLEKDWQRRQEG